MAVPLLGAVTSPKHLIADKAYDADSLRNWLKFRRIKAVIPSTASRTVPYPLDRAVYRRCNLVERLFCRLKNWRLATPGNTIRPPGKKLSRRARSRRDSLRVDLNESST
jgi:transposase